MVKSGQGLAGAIVTRDATGALATPSVGPAGVLYVDGVANGASVTVTGTNPYTWSVTLPALTAGQLVQIYITATISTIPTGTFVVWATADTARISDVETDTQDIQARIPAALVFGRIDASVGAMATDVLTAAALNADAVIEIADALLKRDMSAVTGESARSPLNALRALRNKVAVVDTTMTVYKEDDSTSAWTATVTGTTGADPITTVDPA